MSNQFLGEIKMVAFNFPPRGWAAANGQTMSVQQNQALFSLFGTTYGGNGQTTFALPNLQGRAAMHFGSNSSGSYPIGQSSGEAFHSLATGEIPPHTHTAYVSTTNTQHGPANNMLAASGAEPLYDPTQTSTGTMASGFISNAGASQGHENRMPFLAINFIVAIQGIFPSRN